MRRVLITGGAGFIGSNFTLYMRKQRPLDKLVVLDKLTYAGNLENLKSVQGDPGFLFVNGDINDPSLVKDLFERHSIDLVVNFAAESHVDRSISGPKAFIDTNILGTFTLLEAARKFWLNGNATGDKRFIHVSTDEVYGSLGKDGAFTEDTPYSPNSPYAASKASSDHLVRAYVHTYGLPAITTNCSNNYGPYQFPEKLIPLMIINAMKARPLPVYGEGTNIRDWLYVIDHCSAILTVMDKGRVGETYNIGARNEWRNIDIVNLVCDTVDEFIAGNAGLAERYPHKGARRGLIRFVKDRPGHDLRYAIDPSKIEAGLGWRPATDFRQGVRDTVKWYLENEEWWARIISGEYMNYYKGQYTERLS